MTVVLIGIAAGLATLLGGWCALRIKDKLHLILGFSAGAIVAVAFFDLLPEAIELAGKQYNTAFITSIAALGFLLYMILDRTVMLHPASDEDTTHRRQRGRFGAGSLSIHSFLDGVAIGLAFQVSASVGGVVTLAVLAHDFSDGINTVNLMLKNSGTRQETRRWLLLDAAAPVIGVSATLFFSFPEATLGVMLALFCGFFLYIGASDLLPESYHAHPTILSTAMTLLGAALLYAAIRLAAHE